MSLADFFSLFGLSLAASLAAAPVLALGGALLHLRREAFLGVAAPQFAAAGVALALWLLPSVPRAQSFFLEHGHPPMLFLLPFAAGAAMLCLAGYGLGTGREGGAAALAGGFAVAGAVTLALLSLAPSGANFAETMMRGEVLLLDVHDFEALAAVSALALAFFLRYRRELLVDALDPEQAHALGLRTAGPRRALPVVLGVTVGCGVMTLGPVLVFSLLFLPPLAAAGFARGLRGFLAATVAVALLSALAAWPLAIAWDLPYGPAEGLVAGFGWLCGAAARRMRGDVASRRGASAADGAGSASAANR